MVERDDRGGGGGAGRKKSRWKFGGGNENLCFACTGGFL